MKQHEDLTGRKFGRWTVLGEGTHKYSGKHRILYWKCKCECGTFKEIHGGSLVLRRSESCGCLLKEKLKNGLNSTHGMSKTRIYATWGRIIYRCYNKKTSDWYLYGGRGIKVCDRWRYSFENFFEDMGSTYKEGLTIDRKDNDGNYEPENCRWATQKQQQRNKRNSHNITFNGKTQCIAAWAEELGIKVSTLGMRITKYGWSVEESLSGTKKGKRKSSTSLAYNGKTKSITEWAKETGINRGTIVNRLRLGWSAEKTLTYPIITKFRHLK